MDGKRADGGADIKTKHEDIRTYERPPQLAQGPQSSDSTLLADIKAQLDKMDDKLNQLILRSGLR